MNCEGSCEQHSGELRRVHVHNAMKDWGEFTYCAVAIDEDRRRGFTVEEKGQVVG